MGGPNRTDLPEDERDDQPSRAPGATDQRSGGVYVTGGKLHVRTIVGRDLNIVVNIAPMAWVAAILFVALVGVIGLWGWQQSNVPPAVINVPPTVVKPMDGNINIAVADFGQIDAQGDSVASADAHSRAGLFYGNLSTQLQLLRDELSGSGVPIKIDQRGPDEVGRVRGATPDDRAKDAAAMADKWNADVVLYGNLILAIDRTTFDVNVYLRPKRLGNAEELAGQHVFGSVTPMPGNVTLNAAAAGILNQRIQNGTRALAYFVVGLGYFSLGGNNFNTAYEYFQRALNPASNDPDKPTPADPAKQAPADPAIRQILYLFAGKSQHEVQEWDKAHEYYQAALDLNPNYARARLGLAETEFQLSRGNDCEADKVNPAGLQHAVDEIQTAIDAPNQPAMADIKPKGKFYLSRVYMCQTLANVADRWKEAEDAAQAVVREFDAGNTRIVDWAGEAHAQLGLIYWLRPVANSERAAWDKRAAQEYEQAVKLTAATVEVGRRVDRQAVFYRMLGDIYNTLDEFDQSDASFAEAVRIEPDPNTRAKYQDLWNQLRQGRPGVPAPAATAPK